MARFSNDDVEKARQVLRANYYTSVSEDAAGIVQAYFDNEWSDRDGYEERLHELAESAMTYTADQWTTLFCSESTSEGAEALNDMGYTGGDADAMVAPWAAATYSVDLREAMEILLSEPFVLPDFDERELDNEQRLEWLAHNWGRLLFTSADAAYYLVGTPNSGQRGEVDLGVVRLKFGPKPKHSRLSIRNFLKTHLLGDEPSKDLMGLADMAARYREDETAYRVFVDTLLDRGYGEGLGPGALVPMLEVDDDGEQHLVPMLEFINENLDDDETVAAVRGLKVGGSATVGGGAHGDTTVYRRA